MRSIFPSAAVLRQKYALVSSLRAQGFQLGSFEDGKPAWVADGRWHYLATWPGPELMDQVVARLVRQAGLTLTPMPEGVRTRDRDGVRFAINFAPETRSSPAPEGVQFLLGGRDLAPGAVSAWQIA